MLVLDQTKFGRLAPAAGENIRDVDHIILDKMPNANFAFILQRLGDKLILTERGTDAL